MQLCPERFGANVYMHVAVTNTAKHKVHVLGIEATTGLFQVWKDSSVDSAVDASVGVAPEFILNSEETKYLPILAVDRRPKIMTYRPGSFCPGARFSTRVGDAFP